MSAATDDANLPAERTPRLEDHQLEVIVDLVVAGKSYREMARLTGIKAKRIEKLIKSGKNKKFDTMLQDARYRTETAGIKLMKDLFSDDNIRLVHQGFQSALQSTNEELRWEATKDIASMYGVVVPRDQMKGATAAAVQVNLGGGAPEDNVRAKQALAESTESVMKTVMQLAGSLPDMSNNPHISITGTGPQIGEDAIDMEHGIVDVEAVPVKDGE